MVISFILFFYFRVHWPDCQLSSVHFMEDSPMAYFRKTLNTPHKAKHHCKEELKNIYTAHYYLGAGLVPVILAISA